ncbi:MAG TPA: NADH-quinone oxidoreductase subunit M, partial [Aggregatilineales bacterium]|nr:NADH-quinone oxidoreductase subunit M [Aggregatilineales bacterium]
TLGFMIVAFALGLLLLATYDPSNPNLQHVDKIPWISLGKAQINYYVGVDGLSLLLVLLTLLIMPLAVLFSLYSVKERIRLYYAFMLVLEFAMIGVFVAHDLFLFFVFWELSLIPMYFIVGIWGAEQRIYAALKLFLYTMAGSLLMLLAILYIGARFNTFDVQYIIAQVQAAGPGASFFGGPTVEALLFLGFFAAFAVKVPIWPLHSWLPDAHVQAPTAGSVILAGVMLKLGTYGLIRFCLGLFPNAAIAFAPYIAVLAIIGIIYGAWVSYAQSDVKKLVAYSSISHLGFVVLGIFAIAKVDPNGFSAHAAGLNGATLQMINHGISTGGLFLLVGMLYERRHTKAINAFGGIWKVLPIFSGLSLLITLSSMGLPGLNGFIGEFTILLGTFGSTILGPIFAAAATLGVILAAVYLLYMWNKVFMGEVTHDENNHLPPLRWNETLALVIVVIFALLIGLFPGPFFGTMDKSNQQLAANTARFIPDQNNQSARLEIGQGNTQ